MGHKGKGLGDSTGECMSEERPNFYRVRADLRIEMVLPAKDKWMALSMMKKRLKGWAQISLFHLAAFSIEAVDVKAKITDVVVNRKLRDCDAKRYIRSMD